MVQSACGFLANLSSRLRGRPPDDLGWFAVTGYGLELVPRRTVQIEHCSNGHLRLARGDGGVVDIVHVEPLETTFHSIRTCTSQGWGLIGLGFEIAFPSGLLGGRARAANYAMWTSVCDPAVR